MDSKNVLFLGSTAAAVIAGIYVLYGPSEKTSKQKKETCPGLRNLGNTCFLNAVLQALAPCCCIVQWLGDFVDRRINRAYTQSIAFALIKILKVLNNQGDSEPANCASEIVEGLRLRHWLIPPTEEQDAHELFHVLTESLEEETTKYPSVVSVFDVNSIHDVSMKYQPKTRAATRCQGLLPIIPGKDSEHPFRGLLASQLQCKLCGHKNPVRYDNFDSLSLSIPPNQIVWAPMTLDRLLRHYVMSENVQNVECQGCAKKMNGCQPGCNSKPLPKATFMKRLTIGKLPQCLCIHIQRTVWLNNGMPMKRNDHIEFPEVLDMNPYVYHKRKATDLSGLANGLFGGQGGIFFSNSQKCNSVIKPAKLTVQKTKIDPQPAISDIHQPCSPSLCQVGSIQGENGKIKQHLGDKCNSEKDTTFISDSPTQNDQKTRENEAETPISDQGQFATLDEFSLNQGTNTKDSYIANNSSEPEQSTESDILPTKKLHTVDTEEMRINTSHQSQMELSQPNVELAQPKKDIAQAHTPGKVPMKRESSQSGIHRKDSAQDSQYKLMAVVVHLGDVFSGHFVTYRRAPRGIEQKYSDKWLYTSDEQVSRVSLQSVLQSEAYLLFYERL